MEEGIVSNLGRGGPLLDATCLLGATAVVSLSRARMLHKASAPEELKRAVSPIGTGSVESFPFPTTPTPQRTENMTPKRYAIVGTGARASMYVTAIVKTFHDCATLVALCDSNQTRMDFYRGKFIPRLDPHYPHLPTYKAQDFDRMITENKPDIVIVTSMDCTHHQYICRAMELGCDVITEKPMTTDAPKCQQITDTKKATGKNVTVTFNYRYAPRNTKVKEVLRSGVIGEITTIHFEWLLDTLHGADYFRRWHRQKANNGGLLVHKSTHHFDLVNWWIDSEPETVFCMADLKFYGRRNAERRGVTEFYERTRGNEIAARDPFALHIKPLPEDEMLNELYCKAEPEDGYQRDRSVFGNDITIEDNASVMVRYRNKAVLTYTLCAHCPYEGYRVVFNGTKGRLEFHVVERSFCDATEGLDFNTFGNAESGQKDGGLKKDEIDRHGLLPEILVQLLWGKAYPVDYHADSLAGHGGGDAKLLHNLFVGVEDDPLGHAADFRDGAKSILTGIAANESLKTGEPVKITDLIHW